MPIYALDGVAPTLPALGHYWIAPDAVLIGNVTLKEGASIWFGSVLRGDNEPIVVGEGSNIQENCVLHTDPGFPLTLGTNVTVGHMATLHGCIVGDGSLIGMGSTVLNGANIASKCLVGSKALVTEGKVFEPFSLIVGAPAKVARQIDEATAARLVGTAEHYQRNWQRYAKGLKRID
ncbi:gamma carbonic anhydrase family protein [Xanthobacter versatilis]|uniref:gamma carbonic anhydrase family protein n=1 Tax=Xanthobacter autotrophicus (strain ATCC BAA-1158 / Py2) TaxID=78245 RepID=UPI00372A6B88